MKVSILVSLAQWNMIWKTQILEARFSFRGGVSTDHCKLPQIITAYTTPQQITAHLAKAGRKPLYSAVIPSVRTWDLFMTRKLAIMAIMAIVNHDYINDCYPLK